jgi:hypothetical protein
MRKIRKLELLELISFFLLFIAELNAANDNNYFGKDSCSTRDPSLLASKITQASNECPFELQLSRLTYKSNNENEPLIVSVVRKPAIVDENNSHPNDDINIDALLIQAVHSDDNSKVIGSWRIAAADATAQASSVLFKTVDCSTDSDTLVETGRIEDDIIDLEWQFTNQQPLKKDSSIVFV